MRPSLSGLLTTQQSTNLPSLQHMVTKATLGQQPSRTVNAGGQQYHPHSPVGQQYYTTPAPASTAQWRQRQYATAQPDAHVEISDLRKERPLTNEEASREKNFRPDPSTTKKEAARAVRKLDQTTTSVTEKKRDLTEDQRRQVELALLSLRQEWDDETFETALVQLDDELEEKPKESEREGETERERRKDKHRKEDAGRSGAARVSSKPHSKPHSKPKQPKKTTTERQNVPPPQMNNLPPQQNIPPPQQNNPPPQQGIPPPQLKNPPLQPPPRPTETRGPNPAHQAQAYAHDPRTAPAQAPPRRPPNSPVRRAPSHQRSSHHRRPSPPIRNRARSPFSTDESTSSTVFSDADDDTDYTSPSTPSYASSRDFFGRPRQSSRYRESPAHYGIQPKFRRGKPQGEVHIQPQRSHERRPDLGGRQHTIPVLNQQPLPRHMPNPAPGPGFPRPVPGNANMADAVPPAAPSQPPPALVPTGPRPTGPAQFPPPPPPPPAGAQSQGRLPGHNPTAFPSQPNPTPPPGQHNPEPAPGQNGQGFPGGPGSHPPPNMTPRNPGAMNGMNGMGQTNPNQPVNLAGNPVNGPNPVMHPRHSGNAGNTEGNPSQILPQNPALNPTALYAKAYAKGRADIHEEALHMAERVAERVVAAAVPLKAEGRRRGASPVVIQEDRGRGRGRGHDRDRDRDDYNNNRGRGRRSPSRSTSTSRSASRSRSRSRSLDRDRNTRDRRREGSRSVNRRRDREGGERNRSRSHEPRRSRRRGHHDRDRSRSVDRERHRGKTRSRTRSSRSRSLGRQRSGRGQTRDRSRSRSRSKSRSLDRGGDRHRYPSGDRHRQPDRGWDSDRQKGRRGGEWGRERNRSRSLDRVRPRSPPQSHRGPRSGFRIVRPSNGYAVPRDGAGRKGLERDMDRLRLDERDGVGLGDDEFYGQGRNGQFHGTPPTRAWVRDAGRDADRERDIRAERLRRDEEERIRDDFIRRRDSGIDVGPPFGDSNPFVPQPGFGRRTGMGTGMHVRVDGY
ncbi:predicted protein [Chaetomium globosum CBS 148.51]|uniref:Uncharacterized protein n=1 Tax=Chaetomium globosum (strain ATCC 6205 / CBS 148.51 / DSM 1962 / NBRC 6347 / NRRL 1970) TaxID=306901 RepID=Q2H9C0_CHAGB|nr:uncharacterized protein CHGG_03184 [Chaetomium globosum CBS 148.51]EAQ91249.1 predicted protein [Chaetomium globosum CBS 148.51]